MIYQGSYPTQTDKEQNNKTSTQIEKPQTKQSRISKTEQTKAEQSQSNKISQNKDQDSRTQSRQNRDRTTVKGEKVIVLNIVFCISINQHTKRNKLSAGRSFLWIANGKEDIILQIRK